jgi:hypothetical protein
MKSLNNVAALATGVVLRRFISVRASLSAQNFKFQAVLNAESTRFLANAIQRNALKVSKHGVYRRITKSGIERYAGKSRALGRF